MKVVFYRYNIEQLVYTKTFKKRREANRFCHKHNREQSQDYAVVFTNRDYRVLEKTIEDLRR